MEVTCIFVEPRDGLRYALDIGIIKNMNLARVGTETLLSFHRRLELPRWNSYKQRRVFVSSEKPYFCHKPALTVSAKC